jgi:hypothetical protein
VKTCHAVAAFNMATILDFVNKYNLGVSDTPSSSSTSVVGDDEKSRHEKIVSAGKLMLFSLRVSASIMPSMFSLSEEEDV